MRVAGVGYGTAARSLCDQIVPNERHTSTQGALDTPGEHVFTQRWRSHHQMPVTLRAGHLRCRVHHHPLNRGGQGEREAFVGWITSVGPTPILSTPAIRYGLRLPRTAIPASAVCPSQIPKESLDSGDRMFRGHG